MRWKTEFKWMFSLTNVKDNIAYYFNQLGSAEIPQRFHGRAIVNDPIPPVDQSKIIIKPSDSSIHGRANLADSTPVAHRCAVALWHDPGSRISEYKYHIIICLRSRLLFRQGFL